MELVEPPLDCLDDDLGARPCARLEGFLEPGFTEEAFRTARVEDSIGVEDQRVTGTEANHVIDRFELREGSENATPCGNTLDVTTGAQDERKRMAGTGDDQPGALAVGAETDVRGGAKPFLAVATHHFVDDP